MQYTYWLLQGVIPNHIPTSRLLNGANKTLVPMGCQPVTILKQITPPLQKIDITFDRPSGSHSTQCYSQTLKGDPKTHTWALVNP